jgi:hypothetical protein
MADFRKPAQGALKAIQAASKAADEKLAKMLSHSGDKALPLVLPRANPSNNFINQQAERVARQMMGEHVTSGKDTTNLAGRSVKESQRVKGLDYKLSPTGTVAKEVPYIPRKGDVKVAFPGDQTVSNKTLDEVEGFPIDSVQEGGAYYGLGQRHLADPEFWKSTETPAKAVQGKVDRVAELYQPERVIGSHLAMGQMSNNFAMHFADANLRAIDWSKAKPNKIDTFDSIIAYGYKDPKTGEAVKFPNWPGLADREGALAAMKDDSNLRKWFNNRMKTPAITKPLGLPNGLDIQYAITEPRIRDMEINMTGLMTGELKPKALVEAAGNPHNTYTHRILGEAGGPQEVLTPFVIDFPDAAQHIASTKRPSDFTGTIQKVFPHQIVDDQYINQYNQYRQRIKELTGQKKGGAVERKETAEEMDKFHKCFNMHKAFGGAVVKKVDGGKIAKGVMGAFDKASKAADAAMAANKALPTIERDANLAKMLDKSKVKNKAYHATDQDVKRFDPKADKRTENKSNIAGWMTNDPEFANDFASQKFRYWKTSQRPWEQDPNVPEGANIMPVHLSIENPFYATDLIKNLSGEMNMDEANAVAKALGVGVDELLGDIPKAIKYKASGKEREHMPRGFDLVKSTVATDAMKRLGHDGVIAIENGSEVYAPFNSTQIKSATGNRGTYDLNDPDINKAKGGAMLTPTKKIEGFEEEKPMDKSVLEKMHQVIKEVPKLPTSPLGSALNLGYEGYKYFTGKDPVGDFQKELNRKLNPRMDTGSAPVQEFEKFAKGGRVQESPEEMERFHKCFAMHKAFGGAVKKPQKFDNGGIASPSDEVNQGAAFGIYQKPKGGEDLRRGGEHSGFMAELLAKMAKDQGKQEVSSLDKPRAATDLLNRGVLANNPLSAVIDMVNMGLVPLDVLGSKLTGRDIKVSSEKPFLGSEYVKDLMNQYGVTSGEERPMMETALSFASPAAMIKGAIKATDAAKKAPELMKKASDAFTSSKMSPLATEAKTASAGKPTGATYATKQEGPFFRVSPTTLDTSKAKTRGIREGDELQGPTPLGEGAGSTGRETPQLLSSEEVGRIIADPVANEPLNIAKKYTQETQGVDFGVPNIPESSLAKQSAIGRAQQLAVEGSPEYKTAVFDAYAKQMPDVLEQSGAKNYDDLMEKAYRQMAKETDDQFKILPYNFSYHRAGEGNYNGAMDMASDVHGNKHLYVYQGGDKHDFLNRIDPASGLNENEKFRAVHDLLGHAIYGNQFGPKGEEMAWAVHSQMYSPLARLAMTAETRGQNSMVNYSPLNANLKAELAKYDNMANEARRKGDEVLLNKINAAKRQAYAGFEFAPNKAVLLPPEFLSPQYAGGMPDYLQAANRPAKGTETQSALTHFSNDPNLQMLDPKRYGTGIKGAEAERLRDYAGGVKDRSYFYMGEPSTVTPEAGLGVNRYRGEASSLYDITQDPLNFQTLARESNRTPFTAKVNQGVTYPLQDANDIERLVKEYGYEGMANPKATKPMAIMFKETPVRRQARGGLTLMK